MVKSTNVRKSVRRVLSALAGMKGPRNNRRRVSRRSARRTKTRITRIPRQMTRALPAAYASHVRARFNMISRTASSCRCAGTDLIYPIPATVSESTDTLFAIFPCNPAYWSGTRIAQIAPAYQNYRPIRFRVSYIPQVAVTQPGTVFMGTLWNEGAPINDIQQSLFTSNGGCLTQCYIPCDTVVSLGSNLQQNLFQMTDSLNPDTCPFLFLAGVRGGQVVPGYFYVTYEYEFKNPIGRAWTFYNSGLTTYGALPDVAQYNNQTIVLTSQLGNFGPGTQLDRESNGVFYHGSPVTTLTSSTPCILYANTQNNAALFTRISVQTPSVAFLSITSGTELDDVSLPFDKTASGGVSVPSHVTIYFYRQVGNDTTYSAFVNTTDEAQTVSFSGPTYYTLQSRFYSDSITLQVEDADGTIIATAFGHNSTGGQRADIRLPNPPLTE